MTEKIIIATDSTTDLGAELLEKYNVRTLPMGIFFAGKQHTDGVDITPEMIYENYEKTGELPKTSAINIAQAQDFFADCTSDGSALIMFSISSEMSSSYTTLCLAAEDFPNVHVVDTRNLSTGGGLLVVAAGEMVKAGDKTAAEIAEACREMGSRVDASFIIDSLEFLYKGGRCSAVAMFGANALGLKPCIAVKGGKMGVGKKYRGKFDKVLLQYITERIGNAEDICLDRVFVTHAGCDDDIVASCVEKVKETAPFKEVLVTRAGCTVSSHCGRNTLGVLFVRKAPIQ